MSLPHDYVNLMQSAVENPTEVMLEQGPAAIEEAASFGGKKLRQSYDAVARFQLESRAENHEFWDRKVKKATVPERPREESSNTALKAAAEDRRAQRSS